MPTTASTDDFLIEIARREGRLTEAQLETARNQQRAVHLASGEDPPLLARVLCDQGVLTDRDACELLAADLGLATVAPAERQIDGAVLSLVDGAFARRHLVLPLAENSAGLQVAVADPLALEPLDELGQRLGHGVETLVAPRDELEATIARYYGGAEKAAAVAEDPAEREGNAASPDDDVPVIRRVQTIIANAVRLRASDIHLEPLERRFRVRYRIDGRLLEVESPPKRWQLPLVSRVKLMADISIAEKRLPQDGRIQLRVAGRAIDLRVSTVPTAHGESVVMRILDAEGLKPGLGELGLMQDDVAALRDLVGLADGMVLVTGPTGSGKTTTLYSCLHEINRPDRKIITVEDPVEYQLAGINQVPVRAEIGLTFASALRAMLRQAPNIVMVGEIRDQETAEIAVNASLTGHLVFSTLHTNDAPGAVTRMIDLGVPPFLIANALRAVVAQRLVRRICCNCREEIEPDATARDVLAAAGLAADTPLSSGCGCAACHGTGYRGRIAIFEFFVVNPAMERMIHQHAGLNALRDQARRDGMRTLREDGLRKAVAGVTTLDEVLAATVDD